jgi:hypothetical protein
VNPGSVFFDENFAFHDGVSGEKLFIVLGTIGSTSVAAKTTSQQHGRGTVFGCQPTDRFHNFFLPPKVCYLKKETWVCLDELYELNPALMLKKRFSGQIKHICDIEDKILRLIQDCALVGLDISPLQTEIITASLVAASRDAMSSPSAGAKSDEQARG